MKKIVKQAYPILISQIKIDDCLKMKIAFHNEVPRVRTFCRHLYNLSGERHSLPSDAPVISYNVDYRWWSVTEKMTTRKPMPIPLFDSLQQMLTDEDYQPSLTANCLQDYLQARNFLLSYRGSLDTFNSYRREIERFLQWCQLKANKTLKQIRRDDFEEFLDFCQKPLKSWIALKVEKRFIKKSGIRIPNPKWRSFVVKISKTDTKVGKQPDKTHYNLSEKSFKSIFAVISSYYNYLIQAEYTLINPALMIRQKSKYFRKQQVTQTIRRLSELQWGYVIEPLK